MLTRNLANNFGDGAPGRAPGNMANAGLNGQLGCHGTLVSRARKNDSAPGNVSVNWQCAEQRVSDPASQQVTADRSGRRQRLCCHVRRHAAG